MRLHCNIFACIFLACFTAYNTNAQNLVPNPDFEKFNACPGTAIDMGYSDSYDTYNFPTVDKWIDAIRTDPNYLNSCTSNPDISTPFNHFGYQAPRSGNAYVGLYALVVINSHGASIPNVVSEYVQAKLNRTLEKGHRYYMRFYTSLSGSSAGSIIALDRLGMVVSDTQLTAGDPAAFRQWINSTTAIQNANGNFITDTTGWVKINGIYTAAGTENYVVLGHFFDGPADLSYKEITHTNDPIFGSYYYIDDVCITDMEDGIKAGRDTMVCEAAFPITLHADTAEYYSWSTGANTSSVTIDGPGTYWLTTVDDCVVHTDTIHIYSNSSIIKSSTSDTTVCTTAFPVTIKAHGQGPYIWNTGSTSSYINAGAEGIYWVKTIDGACNATIDSFRLFTNPAVCKTTCVWAPGAFTPNNDGRNDIFHIIPLCKLYRYYVRIFNRWGNLVYASNDITQGWDGTYKGKPAENAVYYYYLSYITEGAVMQAEKMVKGNVTLVR